jgi:hypothetical protein
MVRMDEDRRLFLKSLGMAALAPLLGAGPAAALPAVAAGPALTVTALGGAFLVNGWILSRADLAALGIHAD